LAGGDPKKCGRCTVEAEVHAAIALLTADVVTKASRCDGFWAALGRGALQAGWTCAVAAWGEEVRKVLQSAL